MSTLLTAEKEMEEGQDECGRNQESMPDVTNSSGKSQPEGMTQTVHWQNPLFFHSLTQLL